MAGGDWEDAPSSRSSDSGWEDAPASVPPKKYGPIDAAVSSELAMTLGSGIGAQIASGIGGIAGAVLPGPPGQGADWQRRIAENATYQPRGKLAGQLAQVAGLPGEALAWGANKVGETINEAPPPSPTMLPWMLPSVLASGSGGGSGVNALIQAAPMALSLRGGTPKTSAPTVTEQAAAKYRGQGFSLTPAEGGAGMAVRTVENLSGPTKLAKQVSEKNVPVVSDKIGADFGLPKGTPITQETLAKVEKGAWEKYAAVRQSGRITTDAEYVKALDKVEQTYKSAATDFPEASKKLGIQDTADVVDSLRKGSFDANSAVDIVKNLREGATKAYNEGNGAHARAMRQSAKAIEDQIDRHLSTTQSPGSVVQEFRDARKTLAKVHDARKALDKNESLNPQAYAEMMRRNPSRLSGGSREVAEFARDNPRSAQKVVSPSDVRSTVGIGDVGLGLAGGGYHMLAHGLTGGAAIPASLAMVARPSTRAFLASKAGQAALGYRMPPLSPGLERLIAVSQSNRRLSDELK